MDSTGSGASYERGDEETSRGDSCCGFCVRGLYSCRWSKDDTRRDKRMQAYCWSSVVTFAALLSLCWMYICLVTFNDQDDVNWKGFTKLQRWVNWFMVLIIVSAVVTCYCVLLLLFALFQVALREPLNLHLLHKVLLFFGVLFICLGVTGISLQWRSEWPTVLLSLQATAPFLQFGAVGALTLLSPFVFQSVHMAKGKFSKFLVAVVFAVLSLAVLLCPLLIESPCLREWGNLTKPMLIGHRGAPMLAPENTMMSFNKSMECDVWAFETDVQLSKDRVPFLMHDHRGNLLRRTTDVREKFPEKDFNSSSGVTWEELQSLNAGKWFLQTDPYRSVSQLSEEDKETASNQTIPSLLQLLNFAKDNNVRVMFDLYSADQKNDMMNTVDTVKTIMDSGIDPSLVLWLPPTDRDYVMENAPGFIHVYNNERDMLNYTGSHLNLKYNSLNTLKIRALRERNISVNLWVVNERWLFSLLWCAGVSSVTTNSCHLLKAMDEPDWIMSLQTYTYIWATVGASAVVVMMAIYICQRSRGQKQYTPVERERTLPFLTQSVGPLKKVGCFCPE